MDPYISFKYSNWPCSLQCKDLNITSIFNYLYIFYIKKNWKRETQSPNLLPITFNNLHVQMNGFWLIYSAFPFSVYSHQYHQYILKSVLAAKVLFHDACFTAPSVINVHWPWWNDPHATEKAFIHKPSESRKCYALHSLQSEKPNNHFIPLVSITIFLCQHNCCFMLQDS